MTIELSSEFSAVGGGLGAEGMMLNQIIFTATQFPTVNAVDFVADGNRLDGFGSHGFDLRDPLERTDLLEFLALIVLDSPTAGAVAGNPVRISGLANLPEGTIGFEILDVTSDVIREGFAVTTCRGCWGEFDFEITYISEGLPQESNQSPGWRNASNHTCDGVAAHETRHNSQVAQRHLDPAPHFPDRKTG